MSMSMRHFFLFLALVVFSYHQCDGTATSKSTFKCAAKDIVPKQLDRCWSYTIQNHVTNTQTENIACCPRGYFCCEGNMNANSGKPPCCPLGSACKTDGTCEIPKRVAECHAWGDPHYVTFDGQKIDYQGVCRLSLAKSHVRNDNSERFEIFGKNENQFGNTKVSYDSYIEIYIANDVYRLQRNPKKKPPVEVYHASGPAPVDIKAKGKPIDLSKSYVGRNVTITMLTAPAHTIYLSTDFGVEITYDGEWTGKIFLHERYKKHVTGLCGNYDGNRGNDMVLPLIKPIAKTKGKRAVATANQIGNHYIVKDVEPHAKHCVHKTTKVINPAHDLIIMGACQVIRDKKGPFAKCAKKLGKAKIRYAYDSCVYDGVQVGYLTVCENIKDLMDECNGHQLPINPAYEPKCDLDLNKCF